MNINKVKIKSFLTENWKIIAIALGIFFFVLPTGKGIIARAKSWISVSKYKSENTISSIDYHLLAMRLNDCFRGSWFKEDETESIAIINSLPSAMEFNQLVYQYATDIGKDLRADLVKYLNNKQYAKLKYK